MQIGKLLGITDRTLRTRYRKELDTGFVRVLARVGDKLLDKIEAGEQSGAVLLPAVPSRLA
jgi:hypothetical protein